jgi:hypothetical protein
VLAALATSTTILRGIMRSHNTLEVPPTPISTGVWLTEPNAPPASVRAPIVEVVPAFEGAHHAGLF